MSWYRRKTGCIDIRVATQADNPRKPKRLNDQSSRSSSKHGPTAQMEQRDEKLRIIDLVDKARIELSGDREIENRTDSEGTKVG